MFLFTSHGLPITPDADAITNIVEHGTDASDVKYLPLWVAAATKAETDGYPSYYDRLAEAVGGPTLSDLVEAGLMPSDFTVTLSRRVPITVWIDQRSVVTVKANDVAGARAAALMPSVAYFAGGMYSSDIVANIATGYHSIDTSLSCGDKEIVSVEGPGTDTGV